MNYFILQKNEQKGPYTGEQIQSMWHSGLITADAAYCVEGGAEWLPVKQLLAAPQPPPLPPKLPSENPTVKRGGFLVTVLKPAIWFFGNQRRMVAGGAIYFLLSLLLLGVLFRTNAFTSLGGAGLVAILAVLGFALFAWFYQRRVVTWISFLISAVPVFLCTALFVAVYVWGVLFYDPFKDMKIGSLWGVSATTNAAVAPAKPDDSRVMSVEQLQNMRWQQAAEKSIVSSWVEYLPAHAQEFFDEFHPVGEVKKFRVDDVTVKWLKGQPAADRSEIVEYDVTFRLFWEGPLTKSGFTEVCVTYNNIGHYIESQRVTASNGLTKTDLVKGTGEIIEALIKEQNRSQN